MPLWRRKRLFTDAPWPTGVGRLVLAQTDSTNAHAARLAQQGTAGPLWILALAQTAARGRRWRQWDMAPGNFAATLLMTPQGAPAAVALRSFVAALALYDALADALSAVGADPASRLSLKWPNDVLLDDGKVAGILLESTSGPQGRSVQHLAVGIGVNLIAAPAMAAVELGAVCPVSLTGQGGPEILPEPFLAVLAGHFALWEAQLTHHGFAPIRQAWLARAARLGQKVVARLPGGEIAGRFDGIDDTGALLIETAQGRETIAAADVFFA